MPTRTCIHVCAVILVIKNLNPIFLHHLGRISISQGGSLSLFVSKEAEYETRAGLLKRLAFTIFCSETDQYLKLIPDIQGEVFWPFFIPIFQLHLLIYSSYINWYVFI